MRFALLLFLECTRKIGQTHVFDRFLICISIEQTNVRFGGKVVETIYGLVCLVT